MFPEIFNIDDVLPYIKDREEFSVTNNTEYGYTSITYNVEFEDTFLNDGSLESYIRRECRGIIFDENGVLIRRPFHKFFNVGQKEWTQQDNIDWTEDHCVLDKLDGSMIAPFLCRGELLWGTKAGVTDVSKQVHDFLNVNYNYKLFSLINIIKYNYTPIFEWLSPRNRIVLDYGPEEKLVLTALRNINSGEYVDHNYMCILAEEFGVAYVDSKSEIRDIKSFMAEAKALMDEEGYVIRFDSGDMVKVKADHYLQIHRVLDGMRFEKNVIELCINDNIDDVIEHIDKKYTEGLIRFHDDLHKNLKEMAYLIMEKYTTIGGKSLDRKEFALSVKDHPASMFLFNIYKYDLDVEGITLDLYKHVMKHTHSQTRVDGVRWLFNNIKWSDYSDKVWGE